MSVLCYIDIDIGIGILVEVRIMVGACAQLNARHRRLVIAEKKHYDGTTENFITDRAESL